MQSKLPHIKNIGNIKGKRVILRLGLNAATKNGKVIGGFRIKKIIPTIKFLKEKGAKVIIMGHIGRDPKESLRPVVNYINRRIKIGFVPYLKGRELPDILAKQKNGTALILENLRSNKGETKNDPAFAKYLASLGDIYVNEAFSVAHRKHASIVGIPKYLPSFIGFQFADELKHLEMALKPARPFLFILGGAKPTTKMALMKKFLKIANRVFIGGALANDFYKAKGFDVGKSLLDKTANVKSLIKNKKLMLPVDVVVKTKNGKRVANPEDISRGEIIADAGPETIKELKKIIGKAKFVLWNGPLGNYEEGFEKGTLDLLKILAKARAKTIIGGGDTLAVAFKHKLHNKFTFVSTGGGAMLDYLADGKLPAIDAIKNSKK